MNNNYTLITGATSGIGYELAKLFAKDKNNLIIVGRDTERLKEVKAELEEVNSIKIYSVEADLKLEASVEKVIKFVDENNLTVENLVNNAGFGSFGHFHEVDTEKDLDMIKVNIYALTRLTKSFLPKIIELGKGGVLNVASTAAFAPGPKMSVYYATKAYVLSLTEALGEELKDTNIRITALCPGPVKTNFQSRAEVVKSEKAKKYMMDAETVAYIGYKDYFRGKLIVIPGLKNKFMIQALRIAPRSIIRKIIRGVNTK